MTTSIPYLPSAADAAGRQGVVRVVNHGGGATILGIDVFDDEGASAGPLTLSIGESGAVQINSRDLANGNLAKGLFGAAGAGEAAWRLNLAHVPGVQVLTYVRTSDGLLASMHDAAPNAGGIHRVATFNPGSNTTAQSLLRLANPTAHAATATIRGIDDQGAGAGEISASIPAHGSLTIRAHELESGAAPGLSGALGDGAGKWRLDIESAGAIEAMSLLSSATGHLTNLSTAPHRLGDAHSVPLFPSASDALGRQGFVRVINLGDAAARVDIAAFDEAGSDRDPVVLTVGANRTVHFNSDDLELGNERKGLAGSTGAGEGDWRLELTSDGDIDVLAYIRTPDGFLTSMHDVVARVENRYRIPVFNPGRNVNQLSRLRLVNAGEKPAQVTITGIDDAGGSGSTVRTSVAAGTVESYTAAELEAGRAGLEGALGTGAGKWRLIVESDQPITVMNLLESPTGHLMNLSSVATTPTR